MILLAQKGLNFIVKLFFLKMTITPPRLDNSAYNH